MRHLLPRGLADKLLAVSLTACVSCSSSTKHQGTGGTGGSGGESGAGTGGGGGSGAGKGSGGSNSGGRGGTRSGSGGSESGAAGDTAQAAGGTEGGLAGARSDAGAAGADAGTGPVALAELWYGGVSLCGFTDDQLQADGSSTPKVVVPIPSLMAVSDVALDAAGNAWVVGPGSDDVFRFPVDALADPPGAAPDIVISSDALDHPGNLTFDANGGLWVATRPATVRGKVVDGALLRFDLASDASGLLALTPDAQLGSTTAGDLDEIGNIAFDADNNLWVSSLAGLVRFDDPTGLLGKKELEPGGVIDKTGYDNNIHFYSVAFDRKGALWSASGDGLHFLTSVSKFANPGSLMGRTSPAADVTIAGAMDLLPAGGLAFDAAGDLWMATSSLIHKYSDPGSLSGPVDPAATVTLSVKGDDAPSTYSHLLLFPPPASR